MSKTVDERVVSMQFDNKHFESNVQTSMSTLDKLKAKLNFGGATKGLENIGTAAKNVNMAGLGGAVENVSAKFSALQVMGVTALANITNSAVNAGKKMVAALTIDPVKTGFQEYETQMGAVQTILANTKSKGSTLDDVNKALDTLNEYADQTIYNFTEMTRNIGTFTAAGVDLQMSVDSIKGIANLAAVSGSTSQQASTAMYQLSQALAAGKVSLMDWNSVVNAGMGGEVFQNALLRTSELLKTGGKEAVKTYGSFRESLTKGEWLTKEVLTETLKQLSGAYTEADLIAQGFTEKQAKEIVELADTAVAAATEVKTFTQLWDVLEESAQSGWSQTWKLIIGDFEEAKALLSPLADFLTGVIGKMSDARNRVLQIALAFTEPWKAIMDKLNGAGLGKVKDVIKSVGDLTDKLEYYQDIVNKVWRGDYSVQGANPDRRDLLKQAGYDPRVVQDLVNKGYQYKLTVDDIEESYKKFGIAVGKSTEKTEKSSKAVEKLTKQKLKDAGLTEDEIRLYMALSKEADRLGISVEELADRMSKNNGRDLLIESFKNLGNAIRGTFKAAKEAYVEIFNPPSLEEMGIRIYGIISAFKNFTEKLSLVDKETGKLNKTGEKFKRIFKGVFAVIDVITTILGGGFKIAIKAVTGLLNAFDLDILEVAASVGDALVKFRDWVDSVLDFEGIIRKISPHITELVDKFNNWKDSLKDSDNLAYDIVTGIANGLVAGVKLLGKFATEFAKGVVSKIKSALNIGEGSMTASDFLTGFINGIADGAGIIGKGIIELGKKILAWFREVLGIHSPSKETKEDGKNFIQGFIDGISEFMGNLWSKIKEVTSGIIDKFRSGLSKIDWGGVLSVGLLVGLLVVVKKITDLIGSITSPLTALNDMFGDIGDAFKNIGKAKAWESKSRSILNMAISIGILAASIYVLAQIPVGQLWATIGAIAALAAIVLALSFAASKMSKNDGKFDTQSLSILAIAGSLLLLAIAMEKLASIDANGMSTAIWGLTAMVVALASVLVVLGGVVKGPNAASVAKVGVMLLLMAGAFLVMANVIKNVSGLDDSSIKKGLVVVSVLGALFLAVIAVSKLAGENAAKAGAMLLMMSAAFLVMTTVIKRVAKMKDGDIYKGIGVIAALGLLFSGLIAVSKLAGNNAAKAGSMLMMMSVALLVAVGVIKQAAKLSAEDIVKGIGVIALLGVLFAGLVAISHFAGQHAVKAGAMLLMMAGALVVMTAVMYILSQFDPSGLKRALGAMAVLETCLAGLIAVTALAKDSADFKAILITLTAAIVLLVAALVALTFIDPKKLAIATATISTIIGVFAGLIVATKFAQAGKGMIGTLAMMLGVVVLLGGIVVALSFLPNVDTALTAVTALSTLLLTLSAAMVIMSAASKIGGPSIAAVGTMLLVVAGVAAILGIMSAMDITASLETAKSLSLLLLSLSAALLICSVAGLTGMAGLIGIGLLAAFIVAIGALAVGLGALASKWESFETFLDTGIPILEKIAYAIGSVMGNLVAGFSGAALTVLPMLGASLSAFMIAATPFINGLKLIDGSALFGAATLTATIAAITAASVLAGIVQFVSGGAAFPALGASLSAFMIAAMPFIMGIKMVDPSSAKAAIMLADMIMVLTAANLLNSVTSWITGEGSMTEFAQQLIPFGTAMVEFSSIVSGNIDAAAVEAAANAGKMMAEFAKTIPNSGGVVGFFAGENDMDTFGSQLVPFGTAIVRFSAIVAGKVDEAAVLAAANAGKMMAEMADTLPNSGGVVGFFAGENDMDTFGSQLVPFGTAIVRFSAIVAGKVDEAAVLAAANAGKMMAEMADTLPNSGGVVGFFAGENDMDEFGAQIVPFATAMVRFSAIVAGNFDSKAVEAAVHIGTAMAEMEETIPNCGGVASWFAGDNKLDKFGERIVEFGEAMVDFSDVVSEGVDKKAMTATVDAAVKVGEMADTLPEDMDLSRISTGLTTVGDAMVAFSEQISGNVDIEAIKGVTKAGETLANMAAIMPEEVDLTRVTNGLSDFGSAIVDFSGSVEEGIDVEAVTSATNVGKKIVGMIAGLPVELDIAAFVNGISSLGDSLVSFSTSVTDGIDEEAIDIATNAGSKIASMVMTIPNYVDIADFVANLPSLTDAIVNFYEKVNGNVDEEVVASATKAGKKIADMVAEIPMYSDIGDFITNVPKLAKAIVGFYETVKDNVDSETVEAATNAGKKIAKMVEAIPMYSDIGDFITNVPKLGDAIVDFYTKVNGSVDAEAVEAATGAGKKIAKMVESIPMYSDISSFTTNLPSLGSAMSEFATNISSIDFETLNSDIGGFKDVMSAFKSIAKSGIDGLIETFKSAADNVKNAGVSLINNLVKGVKSKAPAFSTLGRKLAVSAAAKARDAYQNFYSAGSHLVSGFAAGISDNDYKAEARARAMARAAAAAAEEELDINSPSKVFRKIGMSIPEGFAMGIDKLIGLVTNSSSSMGDTAITGVQNAISRIADVVNTDIDSQPTIRPVLDLSDVRAGAGAIGNLLGFTPSVGLATNVGAISSMMRQRNQNGAGEEVVSAINKLRKDVANMPRESYNINGITYDDDSVVTDAIHTLVNAAKRERRT